MDILSRLPITTLVTCGCVCKDWMRLFREPYFVKLQAAASPMHILHRDLRRMDGTMCQFGQIVEDKCTQGFQERLVNLRRLKLPAPFDRYACTDSCNGLLCFWKDDPNLRVFVCNPILGEWVSIYAPVRNYSWLSSHVTFVFSAKNNQYKVLRIAQQQEDLRFEIYTLGGTGQWRSIDKTLTRLATGFFDYNNYDPIVLHGSVHWIDSATLTIYCFDVDGEKFRRLPLPSPEGECSGKRKLGVINGCLCVQLCHEDKQSCLIDNVEIWVMKEYGVEKSWIMMLTFHVSIHDWITDPFNLVSPNEDEILMVDDNTRRWLLSYNLKTTRLGCCELNTSRHISYEAAYKPSFISLQEVAKGEEVMVSRIMEAIQYNRRWVVKISSLQYPRPEGSS